MNTYIDKAEALGIISTLYDSDSEHNKTLDKAHEALVAMPTADVQPVKHGRWEKYDGALMDWCECSRCRQGAWSEKKKKMYAYCPDCGAKMDGGAE